MFYFALINYKSVLDYLLIILILKVQKPYISLRVMNFENICITEDFCDNYFQKCFDEIDGPNFSFCEYGKIILDNFNESKIKSNLTNFKCR